MTVSTEVDHNEYTGNGVTTSFPYTFRIFHASDLVVTTSDTNGSLRTLMLNTDYTVTGVGSYSGGAVVLPLPLASAWAISIERSLPVVQETDLRNQGKFFAETHEGAFDYLTMLIQQCFGWARLALLKPSFIARYYDAKQNRIANLADPSAEQDAVNNRSMRSYVDKAVAGVVGGFGWFIQAGSGAIYRTFQDKMRDVVSVRDFPVVGDGIVDDTVAMQNAADASYNLGVPLLITGGDFRITGQVVFRREIYTDGTVTFIADDNGDNPPVVHIYFERKSDLSGLTFNNINVHISPASDPSVYMPSALTRCNFINSPVTIGQESVITAGYDIEHNKFTGSKSRNYHALTLTNVNHVNVNHNEMQEFDYGVLVAPTRSFAANNIVISHNRISGFLFAAVRLQGTSMFRITKPLITKNTFIQGTRDIAQTARGAIMSTWVIDLEANNNSISCVSAAITLQSVQGYKIEKNSIKYVSTLNAIVARSCSDAVIRNNDFEAGNRTGTYAILVGANSLTPITTGDTYPSKNLTITENRFTCRGQAVKVENTDNVLVSSNSFTSPDVISANGLLFFGTGVTNGNHFDNKFFAPSGTPVRNDSGAGVTAGVGTQALVVATVSGPTVSAPVITAVDAALNNAKSYLTQFALGDYKQIKQLVDIANKKTLSEWMATAVGPTLGWNSSAWNSANNTISDLIVDGLMYDSYGVENFANFRSCLLIDDKNKLTCRNFATSAFTRSVPLMIGAACSAERAWQTATFRCPLVVDGVIYDPVPTGLLTAYAYSVQISGRTALGQKADGTYVLLVVDGATDISGTTMANMAAKLLAAGCLNAFNLDGGGSTTLWYNGSVINNPSDAGGQRAIPSAMYV